MAETGPKGTCMDDRSAIEQRLCHLETSNRRLKAVLTATVVAACGAWLMGANEAPHAVKATSFVLLDDAGRQRALLSSNEKSVALQLLNADGSRGVALGVANDANGLVVFDPKGAVRVALTARQTGEDLGFLRPMSSQDVFSITDNSLGTVIAIRDAAGHEMVDVGVSDKGPGVSITDPNNTPRAVVSPEGFLSFDKGGRVDWASFGEKLSPEERKQVMDLLNQTPQ